MASRLELSNVCSSFIDDFPSVPYQPRDFDFPKHLLEGRKNAISCRSSWFKRWRWLHYNAFDDSVFCHWCVTGVRSGKVRVTKRLNPLINHGFYDWDNAVVCFQKHERTNVHRAAVAVLATHEQEGDKKVAGSSQPSIQQLSSSCMKSRGAVTIATSVKDLPGHIPLEADSIDVNVLAIGDRKCGKTSLLMAMKEQNRIQKLDCVAFHGSVYFWEAGIYDLRKFHSLLKDGVDVILLCFSIDDPNSLKNIEQKWIKEAKAIWSPGVLLYVVGNKIDLRADTNSLSENVPSHQNIVSTLDGAEVAEKLDVYAYMECSATRNIGIIDILMTVADAHRKIMKAAGI